MNENEKEKVAAVFNRIEDIRLRARDVLYIAALRSVDNDDEEAEKALRDGAAEIAAMALELCPPERLAEVADAFKEKIAAKPKASNLEFCGLKLARYGAPGQTTTLIGKRVNPNSNRAQLFEIRVYRRKNGEAALCDCCENDKVLFEMHAYTNHTQAERASVGALRSILLDREYHHKRRSKAEVEGKVKVEG